MRYRSSERISACMVALLFILGSVAQDGYTPIVAAKPDSPVANAIVVANSDGGSGFAFTTPNGHYLITEGLTAGIYNVSAIAEGYINQEVGGI